MCNAMDCTMYKYFAALWLSKRRAQPASSPPSIVYSTRDVSALTFWTCKRIFQSLQVSQLLYIVICATTYSKVLLEKYAAFTVIKIYIPTCTHSVTNFHKFTQTLKSWIVDLSSFLRNFHLWNSMYFNPLKQA